MIVAPDDCAAIVARLDRSPDCFDDWLLLAQAYNARQNAAEGLNAAKNALILQPHSLEALYECGLAQLAIGFVGEAVEAFTTILALQPLHVPVLISLGSAYFHLRRLNEASLIWEQAARVSPDRIGVLEDLAFCYQYLRDWEKVTTTWQRLLDLEPCHPLALHHLSALGQGPALERSSEAYIARLFNEFAADFDQVLQSLHYDGPRLLADFIRENIDPFPMNQTILDLGCGTGLCAPHLRSWAGRLEGVDLSEAMLAKARTRGLYDELHRAEITVFCQQHPARYDLIVAADTLNYFGALSEVFSHLAKRLQPGGHVAFFVEKMWSPLSGDYRLESHGRFSHQTAYLSDCLLQAGLKILAQTEAVVRTESGSPVVATFFLGKYPNFSTEDTGLACQLPQIP